jgi:SnoaL-like domain
MTTAKELRVIYNRFNSGDIDGVVGAFAPNAGYYQIDTRHLATGQDEIRTVMDGWRYCFEGAQMTVLAIGIATDPAKIAAWPGAVVCLEADLIGAGRYVNSFPGLEAVAPAHDRAVRFSLGDTVWFDQDGCIVRINNKMMVDAIQ